MSNKYTKEELASMEKQVRKVLGNLESMSEEEQKKVVNQVVYADQIEVAEFEEANFVTTFTELGLPLERKGRIPFDEVLAIAPVLCGYLGESINPKQSIKRVKKCSTKEGLEKLNKSIDKNPGIRTRDKPLEKEKNELMFKEQVALKEAGLKMSKNTRWSIYKIMRGDKRKRNFEDDGFDVELLKIQNSFLSNEELEEIYELRSELYED